MGVRFHKNSEANVDDARDLLVENLAALVETNEFDIDGVAILLDEADGPAESTRLGELIKLTTERLSRLSCTKVVVGMAGLPSIIPKLRASHESSPRVFETMRLAPLETSERSYVIERGLEDALKINNKATAITSGALSMISHLSEGYPHFVQQFAYFAFDEDKDDNIDIEDVMKGAYKENGALMQLGIKYFDEMYFSKISSDSYRKVLNTMAEFGDAWVSRKEILQKSGIKEININNALTTLKQKSIIHLDDSRQGYYRLPTKSFAAWINAIKSIEVSADRHHLPSIFD